MNEWRNSYKQVLRKRIITIVRKARGKLFIISYEVWKIFKRQIKMQNICKNFNKKIGKRIFKNY